MKIKKILLVLQYSTLKSAVVPAPSPALHCSGHPGLEIKTLYYCPICSPCKVHKSTTICRGYMHLTTCARHQTNLHDWTFERTFTSLNVHNLKAQM